VLDKTEKRNEYIWKILMGGHKNRQMKRGNYSNKKFQKELKNDKQEESEKREAPRQNVKHSTIRP